MSAEYRLDSPELTIKMSGDVWIKPQSSKAYETLKQECPTCPLRRIKCTGAGSDGDAVLLARYTSQNELKKVLRDAACNPSVDEQEFHSLEDPFTELTSKIGRFLFPYRLRG